jgi:RNA polymerase sigma factor (sigma-70 family)
MTASSLLSQAAAGDEGAWIELVGRYRGLLRSIASDFQLAPSDAEDAAQMTWLGLFQNADKLRMPEATPGWLATTMRRNCARVLRHRRREQLQDDWAHWLVIDDSGSVETRILLNERDQILWDSVDRLPARQGELLRSLFTAAEPSYGEVAATMSMAVGTIGPARQRALRNVKQLLSDAGFDRTESVC